MNIPSWIDEKLFLCSLNKYFKSDSIKILGFSCAPAIAVGENYATHVFRVKVSFVRDKDTKKINKENLSLILKCVREGVMEEYTKEMDLFEKEVDMFCNIMPKMNEIYGNHGTFSANCINGFTKPQPVIIVEDLRPSGFRVHDRRAGLDLSHVLEVLKKIAEFHATSVIMCEKDPLVLNYLYGKGIFRKCTSKWIKTGFQELRKMTANCKDLEIYHEKFKKINTDTVFDRCSKSMAREKDIFSVLNHGDLWVTNMMFAYDANGKVKSCKLVDLQLCIYSSPAVDMHYFLTTSLSNEMVENIDYFLDYYYVSLLSVFNKLHYKIDAIPTLKEFKEDFRKRAFYGLVTIATVLPLVKAEHRKDANIEDIIDNECENNFREHCYNNDLYKSMLSHLLPYYDNLGVFSQDE